MTAPNASAIAEFLEQSRVDSIDKAACARADSGRPEPRPMIPWPRRCGYCTREVLPGEAYEHWGPTGGVSRCRHRREVNE